MNENNQTNTYTIDTNRVMLSDAKFYGSYSRFNDELDRYETWNESVERVMQMHRKKYAGKMTPVLSALMDEAEQAYKEKLVLGAQRALQFGGDQIINKNARAYNCSVSYADRPNFFNGAMWLLLCGCGVGFSVQKRHIDKLPNIKTRTKKTKLYTVPDTIEGWADAFAVLLSTYFEQDGVFPEYKGCHVAFDFSKIRPKGAHISGGFKAPGPAGLRDALVKCEELLEREVQAGWTRMRSIVVYDFVMHMSDAVLSGGVRRSATICLFDKDDQDMLTAKTGNWMAANPQRARSNNSVMLKRDELTKDEWDAILTNVKHSGEPGFVFTDSLDFLYNPCVEIGMLPQFISTDLLIETGFQFCNLTEINGSKVDSVEKLIRATRAAAILGTLQAGYTDFDYLKDASKKITEREALIGVSITGWMDNPDFLFDKDNMILGAENVKAVNKLVAELISINQAARTTCAKPAGNASVILMTPSGIHGDHSKYYIRNVQMNEQEEVLQLIRKHNPKMVEKSVWSGTGTDYVVSFPLAASEKAKFKKDLMGVKQLEYVKLAQQYWVEYGTNVELGTHPKLRHNISNTISVDDWQATGDYIYENRHWFAGISLMSAFGDKGYAQAPFTEVLLEQQIVEKYGAGSLFASGLVVDGLSAFNDNLWLACATLKGEGLELDETDSKFLMHRDWVRRAAKFAVKYFDSDVELMIECLKDCYNLHKWESINRNFTAVDFATQLGRKEFTDVDTLAGEACAGGTCDVKW